MTKYYDSDGNEIPIEKVAEQFTKQTIEFNRYKQDCRKRALDLAHCEYPDAVIAAKDNKTEMPDLLKNADKYYNWLISIE